MHTWAWAYSRWVANGGNRGAAGVYAVAVAQAESGMNDRAVSTSHDSGLWQINSVHAAQFPNLWPLRFTVDGSARMAIAISGNGHDWGPWCTAWSNPANCGHHLGPVLQSFSPAGSHVVVIAAALGLTSVLAVNTPPLVGAVNADTDTPAASPWSRLQDIFGPTGTDWHHRTGNALSYLKGFG